MNGHFPTWRAAVVAGLSRAVRTNRRQRITRTYSGWQVRQQPDPVLPKRVTP